MLLTLSAPSNSTNHQALATITSPLLVAASVTASAAFLDGILLPSPMRKTKKTSHQKQIDRQNECKQKDVHNEAPMLEPQLSSSKR